MARIPYSIEREGGEGERTAVGQRVTLWTYWNQVWAVGYFLLGGLYFSLQFFLLKVLGKIGKRERREGEERDFRQYLAGLYREFLGEMCRRKLLLLEDEGVGKMEGEGGVLLVANHPGLFDAIILLACLPDTVCVMRAGLLRQPAVSGGALRCGFIPNDSGVDFVRAAVGKLRGGEKVLIFPEGTRTEPGKALNMFKGGAALIAIRAGVPVQTVVIEMEGNMFRKGVSVWCPARIPVKMRIRLGERFFPEEGESAHELTARMQGYFVKELGGGGK